MDEPRLTASMRIALADLKLAKLHVACPGVKRNRLATDVEVIPLAQLVDAP